MRPPRAVFFDAGHTLLHAWPSVPEIYAAEARRLGADVTADQIAATWPPLWKRFTQRYAADPANGAASEAQDRAMWRVMLVELAKALPAIGAVDFETWFDRLYTLFGTAEVWRLYDDAIPALEALRDAGIRVAVVSNWDLRLRRIATELGLDRRVDFAVISAECGARKPDRRIFDRALELAGSRPEEAVHVGDLYDEDVVGAQRAGIRAVLLDRAGHGRPHHAEGEVEVARDLREAVGIVTASRRRAP